MELDTNGLVLTTLSKYRVSIMIEIDVKSEHFN